MVREDNTIQMNLEVENENFEQIRAFHYLGIELGDEGKQKAVINNET